MGFDESFEIVMEIEGYGVLVNDPQDNGGLTKWGISHASHPELSEDEIRNLTKTKAKALYKKQYWDAVQTSKFPMVTRLAVFDSTVNHGASGAARMIQRAANQLGASLRVDGIIGPVSQSVIKNLDSTDFLLSLAMERLRLYQKHEDFARFGNGWTRRLFTIAFKTV